MAYKWGGQSAKSGEGIHPLLWSIITDALDSLDITVQQPYGGRRTVAQQQKLYATRTKNGKRVTHKDGITNKSNHQGNPSRAVDIAPWVNGGIPWEDTRPWYLMAGVVLGIAQERGVKLRWLGDLDGDGDITDETFNDLGHFELVNIQ